MEKVIKEIKCDVTNCVYHKGDCTCTAGHITVGPRSACTCSETTCNTFESATNNQTSF